MIEVRISGAEQIKRLARELAAADKGLGRQMGRALTKAVEPLTKAITEEAGRVAPSGYRETLTRSLKYRRSLRDSPREASVRLITSAYGKSELRDLPSINAGRLRHPVFGRGRKLKRGGHINHPWAVTTIRSGFYDRGIQNAGDEAEQRLLEVLDEFADKLSGG